ncbi:hypothetical protein B0H17DRAFT_1147751 [Mycena rosella]|uniref:Uncharacterized protein n=1 Tax=Mycena rosella TaxID=1033263 RepID=A0AAD7CHP3_MYCRO|nr:hypothetical protein B0H17DRAFT_1147751 [Mycena rosella]
MSPKYRASLEQYCTVLPWPGSIFVNSSFGRPSGKYSSITIPFRTNMDVQKNSGSRIRTIDVWFDNGTVLLQTGTIMFRAYRGVLAAPSLIFRHIFAIPQRLSRRRTKGVRLYLTKSPVSEIHTSSWFPRRLRELTARRTGYFVKSPVSGLSTVSALLRLATKYDVDHLRTRITSLLTIVYPKSLSEWRARKLPPGYKEIQEDDFWISLLPTAFSLSPRHIL